MAKGINDATWALARVLYEARIKAAWGNAAEGRMKWPDRRGYEHARVADVDLALEQAQAVLAVVDDVAGWQLIDTAPRCPNAQKHEERGLYMSNDGEIWYFKPTHWRPLTKGAGR